MGRPKLSLPFGDETMLGRIVRIVGEVVTPVVVVASLGQELPPLPAQTLVAHDSVEGQGPLAGIAAGIAALYGRVDAAYVSSCDVPLLKGEFIRVMIESLGTHEIAVPREGEYDHPLAAVYRTTLERRAIQLLNAGKRRLQDLVAASHARRVSVTELRRLDPSLESLRNVNTPADYAAAVAAARIPHN
jgi:molybdopterin-guanine dinucleotide biosynthesis protein A